MKKKMNCVHSNTDLIDDLYSLVLPSKPVTLRCLATFCFLWLPLPHSWVMQCFNNREQSLSLAWATVIRGPFVFSTEVSGRGRGIGSMKPGIKPRPRAL